eukprot:11057405-Prorocentrum_lima.AAC.1
MPPVAWAGVPQTPEAVKVNCRQGATLMESVPGNGTEVPSILAYAGAALWETNRPGVAASS